MYQYKARVLKVIDGDTVDCVVDLGFRITMEMRFRLARIQAPEMKTPDGPKSKARLEELMPVGSEHLVETEKDKKEKYGRYLGTFFDEDGHSINQIMESEGFAKPYPK